MDEKWADIKGLKGYYQVSNIGRVRSVDRVINGKRLKGIILKQQFNKKGYCSIKLNGKMYLVHRLVGEYFVENVKSEPQINHKNGIKDDNRAENLEWCDNLYNIRHSWEKLGRKPPERCGLPKKRIAMLDNNTNEVLKTFDSIRDASFWLCGNDNLRRNIAKAAKGYYGRKTCCGYKWILI